jgi:hypothetical protein
MLLRAPGEPGEDMPDTLFLLELVPDDKPGRCWRCCGGMGGTWGSLTCKLSAGSDCCAIEGGVSEPLEGAVPWL